MESAFFAACERAMSTKSSLHPSSRMRRGTAPDAVRSRPGQARTLFKKLTARKPRSANLRHELVDKITTVVVKHVARIDDAEVPHVLRQLKAGHMHISFVHVARPAPVVLDAESAIAAENEDALERAEARGTAAKVELLKRPDMLTGAQLAERLGLTRATVDKRRTEGKLLALDFGTKRGFRYPAWQSDLVQDADARAAFEQVLSSLAEGGVWSRYRFFTQAAPALGGATPIEALRAGRREEVLRTARTWAAGEQGGG